MLCITISTFGGGGGWRQYGLKCVGCKLKSVTVEEKFYPMLSNLEYKPKAWDAYIHYAA